MQQCEVVPAVQNAHQLTTVQLDEALSSLVEATRAGKATQADLTGGTFTLNNYAFVPLGGSRACTCGSGRSTRERRLLWADTAIRMRRAAIFALTP
jgi:pyruvate/2-oxoglutarate dehydrogenase complex dihydrolipoamide acyltransferase (E2) component